MIEPPDFDELYGRELDPWQVGSSWYEQRKLAVVAATLRRQHYAAAWDPACGTGHLARHLASIADRVLATDGAAGAIEISRTTCSGLANVEFETNLLPAAPHGRGPFDLVVLSEFLYYLPPAERRATLATVRRLSRPDAEVLAVHWRHRPHDAYASGDETQSQIVDELSGRGWSHAVRHREEDFVIDVMERTAGQEAP
jgi:2-polyprenyl-3-methyl-5-hydroxy-6-metoxy-1,4-benzoquinol methylase